METLGGYVAGIAILVAAAYLSGLLEAKARVVYWGAHAFTFTIPRTPPIHVTTTALTVQNIGRRVANEIEVAHDRAPEVFSLWPQRIHTMANQGEVRFPCSYQASARLLWSHWRRTFVKAHLGEGSIR
jgi:hypothetical protein